MKKGILSGTVLSAIAVLLLACSGCSRNDELCSGDPNLTVIEASRMIVRGEELAASSMLDRCLFDETRLSTLHRKELVYILSMLGEIDRAEKIANDFYDKDVHLVFQVCAGHDSKGSIAKALSCYLSIEPEFLDTGRSGSIEQVISYDIKLRIAEIYEDLGSNTEVLHRAEQLHAKRPRHPEPAFILTRALLRSGDQESIMKAIGVIKPFTDHPYPSDGHATAIDLLAYGKWKLGEREAACQILNGRAPSEFSKEVACSSGDSY
jgi:hypothetical protein